MVFQGSDSGKNQNPMKCYKIYVPFKPLKLADNCIGITVSQFHASKVFREVKWDCYCFQLAKRGQDQEHSNHFWNTHMAAQSEVDRAGSQSLLQLLAGWYARRVLSLLLPLDPVMASTMVSLCIPWGLSSGGTDMTTQRELLREHATIQASDLCLCFLSASGCSS